MDIAVSKLTGQIVYANRINYDNGNYICKICGGQVVWVRSRVQKPHFRHLRGEASTECEYYSKLYIQQDYSEYNYQSLGLPIILNCQCGYWNLLLHLPEFDKCELDSIGLNNFFDIKFLIDDYVSVEASKLWPGKGGALCHIQPHSFDYKVKCITYINNFDFSRWNKGAKGLDPSGIFFKHSAEGGCRIPKGKTLNADSTVYLLAHIELVAVPEIQWPKSLKMRKVNESNSWCVWEIDIPKELGEDILQWIGMFGYYLADSGFTIDLLWPTPYKELNDGSYCIDANSIIFNIICQSSNTEGVLFHSHNNRLKTYNLEEFVNNSKIINIKNLEYGSHSFFIDRFSESVNVNVLSKGLLPVEDLNIIISVLLSNKTINYTLSEKCYEQKMVLGNEHMGLEISGINGMKTRLIFKRNSFVRHIIYESLPIKIENVFDLMDTEFDSIIVDFNGYGTFILNTLKDELNDFCISVQAESFYLLRKVYLEALAISEFSNNPKGKQILEAILILVHRSNFELGVKKEMICYINRLKHQQSIPVRMNSYLFYILEKLQSKQKEGNVYGKSNSRVI